MSLPEKRRLSYELIKLKHLSQIFKHIHPNTSCCWIVQRLVSSNSNLGRWPDSFCPNHPLFTLTKLTIGARRPLAVPNKQKKALYHHHLFPPFSNMVPVRKRVLTGAAQWSRNESVTRKLCSDTMGINHLLCLRLTATLSLVFAVQAQLRTLLFITRLAGLLIKLNFSFSNFASLCVTVSCSTFQFQ